MVSGVEPSLTARTKAQELTQQKIHSSLKELDAKDFHAITLWHVLEHVPDLENIVEKLTSKLKKDGTIFIAVPNHESYDAKYYGNIWAAYDVPRHLWHFSRKNITMLMERNGLRLKTITPMKLDSFYVSMLSESYRNNSASSISNFLKAMWIGMKSNQKAATSGNYSSLIYIFTK
jgi:2-polyprenyl-3-methyl-5-hydroxy-6-metoxy-1,4-benzoquinol methylase